MKKCIFCDIVSGIETSYKIWENKDYLAFLSIYPNTPGVTVVIPKKHYSSYAFDLEDKELSNLIIASKMVVKQLDSKLPEVGRTALVLEGFGVDHVHAKLFPMHGTGRLKEWKPIKSDVNKYFNQYEGYISSHDYKRANDEDLKSMAEKLGS
jgi:diadenosine tetraphosphate (Ap4A) HIT family hydrolase